MRASAAAPRRTWRLGPLASYSGRRRISYSRKCHNHSYTTLRAVWYTCFARIRRKIYVACTRSSPARTTSWECRTSSSITSKRWVNRSSPIRRTRRTPRNSWKSCLRTRKNTMRYWSRRLETIVSSSRSAIKRISTSPIGIRRHQSICRYTWTACCVRARKRSVNWTSRRFSTFR